MINQHESPFYTEEAFQCQRMHKRIVEPSRSVGFIRHIFRPIRRSLAVWICVKKYHPLDDLDGAWNRGGFIQNIICRDCITESTSAFPAYVEELEKDVE